MAIDMSEQKEKLSAYLDDAESINFVNDAGVDGTVMRYHLIGEAMRGELSDLSMLDVSSQVREAVAQEPSFQIAPAKVTVEDRSGLLSSLFDFGGWLRPVGGLAIAASVAVVAIISLQQGDVDTGVPAQVVASQDAAQTKSVIAVANPVANTANPELDRYLDEHSEFAARDTMQGRLPYVRAVGYKSR